MTQKGEKGEKGEKREEGKKGKKGEKREGKKRNSLLKLKKRFRRDSNPGCEDQNLRC